MDVIPISMRMSKGKLVSGICAGAILFSANLYAKKSSAARSSAAARTPTTLNIPKLPSVPLPKGEAEEKDPTRVSGVMDRLKRAHSTFGASSQSKFNKLKTIFEGAQPFAITKIRSDLALVGKCVSKFNPETFYSSVASVYIERDQILGKQVYFVPMIEEKETSKEDYLVMSDDQIRRIHNQRRSEMNLFSALHSSFPRESPLYDMFKSKMGSAVFFSYKPPTRGLAAAPGAKKAEQGAGVFFRLRIDKKSKKTFMILERMCPYYPGCKIQGDNIIDYLNYVDAYGYCYYTRKVAG
jgi:hypothetical protein